MQIDKSQEGTGDNHAISALKFKIILEFLQAGWNVFLSDVDIVIVKVGHFACSVLCVVCRLAQASLHSELPSISRAH